MKPITGALVFLLASASALAQGTVNFSNAGAGVNAPVWSWGPYGEPWAKVQGTDWVAQLWYGPAGTAESRLIPHPDLATFQAGAQAGYFLGGIRTLNGIPGGTLATLQVRVWPVAFGTTYDEAWQAGGPCGASGLLNITPAVPPATPSPLVGLQPIYAIRIFPEPTTPALAALGAVMLLFLRRRR